jgi:hypothetical protein
MNQSIETSFGEVIFRDTKEMVYSSYCQPRDIIIVSGPDTQDVKEEIAIDVRLGQGHPQVGVAQNLKFA